MTNIELQDRITTLIEFGNSLYDNLTYDEPYSIGFIKDGSFVGFKTLSLSFIKNLYGENHLYFKEFEEAANGTYKFNVDESLSILSSIKFEIENGWLYNLKQLVTAELFSDFLEMSKYLLEEGYKDAAAVMIGSTLEEQLRQLSINNSIEISSIRDGKEIPKKANLLNAELYKANIYNSLTNKSITSWLDLRNNAAHGHYNVYSRDEVNLMYQGVVNFISTI
ncbi:hypothetical protein H1R16_10750 [Marnyiella aurantia]|uniref:DUF4145 domain-containing protein n=1 Tax=Marnyiella aurantia TaxID=2758037 RepID=A0A7D7QKB2_9FLAO|nr:hypothetical protein [Marnyiella aurantia]MBA5246469.1 hypothetical protein [Marnyiella aurantia]QMS98165.1 hypothetical protein H1R16_10750 [Marnyiella aurantia]